MKWILFVIMVSATGNNLEQLKTYDTMADCFHGWEYVNDELTDNGNKSKVNVQLVCLQSDIEQ